MTTRFPFIVEKQELAVQVPALVRLIAATQQADGAIPWWPGDKTDPWDHVEAAMGLTVGGQFAQARAAFEWLQARQLPDGGWHAAYRHGAPADRTCETNHAAYIAAGLYHYLLITGDLLFVRHMWPCVEKAVAFVLRHQAPSGEIWWAVNPQGRVDRMALLAACSSICFSLKCALGLARALGAPCRHWRQPLTRLQACMREKPQHFNMTKARFSMDWFYPVLCGAVTGAAAQERIERGWRKFVIQNMGVRCVSDQPWVTIAESSELVLTLAAMDSHLPARILFGWICDHTFDDATFWCGFTFPDMVLWPEEKISWTNAAVLLAADALYDLTPAGRLFSHSFWQRQGI